MPREESPRRRLQGRENQYSIRAVERAIAVLNTFSFAKPERTLKELAESTGLSKPTVFRILATLEAHNYVALDRRGGGYRLGSRVMELGGIVNSSITLKKVARSHLTNLQQETGATVLLGALMDDELVYVGKRETDGPIRIVSDVGWRRSPHFGMLGLVLMAFQDPEERARLLAKAPLVAHTRFSIVDPEMFLARLQGIRENGYVLEFSEAIEGVWGVASPVFEAGGRVVAAVGTALPVLEQSEDRVAAVVAAVKRAAEEISQDLGHRNSAPTRAGAVPPAGRPRARREASTR